MVRLQFQPEQHPAWVFCLLRNGQGSCYDVKVSKKFVCDYGNGQYELLLFHDQEILKGQVGYEEK